MQHLPLSHSQFGPFSDNESCTQSTGARSGPKDHGPAELVFNRNDDNNVPRVFHLEREKPTLYEWFRVFFPSGFFSDRARDRAPCTNEKACQRRMCLRTKVAISRATRKKDLHVRVKARRPRPHDNAEDDQEDDRRGCDLLFLNAMARDHSTMARDHSTTRKFEKYKTAPFLRVCCSQVLRVVVSTKCQSSTRPRAPTGKSVCPCSAPCVCLEANVRVFFFRQEAGGRQEGGGGQR